MAKLQIRNGVEISDYGKPYIIAELGSNHNGDMNLAKRMIDEAKSAGCSCVKFQSWTKDTIFSKKTYADNYFLNDDYRNRDDFTLEAIVDTFSISEEQLYSMYQYCIDLGIDFTSTPFSKKEADFLVDRCNVPFLKVASMDLNNYPFLRYLARKGVPLVLATGLSDIAEIDKAISVIENEGNTQIVILHCISLYPPKFEDVNLNNIIAFRSMYPMYPVGFSDHSLGVEMPTAAVALGACIIEKHFTLDKEMFGWDHKISANPDEMKTLVNYAQNVKVALGTTRRIVGEDELAKRAAFRRSVVVAKDMSQGTILSEDDLDIKRPGTGIPPEKLDWLIGKRLKRDVAYDEMLKEEDVL